jgi:hypothetical protein
MKNPESLDQDDDTILDLDTKNKNVELTSGTAKEVDKLDIDAFEFDADDFKLDADSEEDSRSRRMKEELDLETFSFDAADISEACSCQLRPSLLAIDDENVLDFDFDKSEIEEDKAADAAEEPEDIETFAFDGDLASTDDADEIELELGDESGAASVESDATEIEIDEVSFDIGEEIAGEEEDSTTDSDEDDFDFDLDGIEAELANKCRQWSPG